MGTCYNCMYLRRDLKKEAPFWSAGVMYYCTWFKQYVKGESDPCGQFEDRGAGERTADACYLTTACVRHRGLPDDCEELTILRTFRDGYLKKSAGGDDLIAEYYREAPALVAAIDQRPDKDGIYEEIYLKILECIELIRAGKQEEASAFYQMMSRKIKQKVMPDDAFEKGDQSC